MQEDMRTDNSHTWSSLVVPRVPPHWALRPHGEVGAHSRSPTPELVPPRRSSCGPSLLRCCGRWYPPTDSSLREGRRAFDAAPTEADGRRLIERWQRERHCGRQTSPHRLAARHRPTAAAAHAPVAARCPAALRPPPPLRTADAVTVSTWPRAVPMHWGASPSSRYACSWEARWPVEEACSVRPWVWRRRPSSRGK